MPQKGAGNLFLFFFRSYSLFSSPWLAFGLSRPFIYRCFSPFKHNIWNTNLMGRGVRERGEEQWRKRRKGEGREEGGILTTVCCHICVSHPLFPRFLLLDVILYSYSLVFEVITVSAKAEMKGGRVGGRGKGRSDGSVCHFVASASSPFILFVPVSAAPRGLFIFSCIRIM